MIINSNPGKFLAALATRNATAAYREIQEKTMTNAIEQAKREFYAEFENLKKFAAYASSGEKFVSRLEDLLEAYLELLRQDHEALHETARKRFEDLQAAEALNNELKESRARQANAIKSYEKGAVSLHKRLAAMTEERDSIQLRLHAVDHAYKTQQSKGATMHQDSEDRVSCATPDAKTMTILGAFVDIQRIVTNWAMKDVRAKAAMREIARVANGSVEVSTAMTEFEKDRCMHSFFAIGDDQMKCTFCGVGN